MGRKRLISKIILSFFLAGMLLPLVGIFAPSAQAAEFEYNITRTYTVLPDQSSMHITETRVLSNNSLLYYYPASSTETFVLQNFKETAPAEELETKQNSIVVTNGRSTPLTYSASQDGDDIVVDVDYPSALNPRNELTFQLEYDTSELIENVGQVTNIYIPGLDESYEEISTDEVTGTTSLLTYETILEISKDVGEATFTLPEPTSKTETGNTTIYTFATDSILGTTVWHQIGTQQTYYFKITQPVTQADTTTPEQLSFFSKSQYTMLLPRDYSETNQEVFYTNISPSPDEVTLDEDGNVLATFYIDATADTNIIVEGYITVSLPEEADSNDVLSATLNDIDPGGEMSRYLTAAEYWESDNDEIQAKAAELAKGKSTIFDILRADYEFIVDSIDYDDFKYGERNTRKGALATLHGDSSVCMEYSDLLISLARAQGIPARAAYGYGYDPKFAPGEQEEHQWTQAWIPDYGWLTIDPTWGETGREFIGRDLDHALWYVASIHPNDPSPLEVFAASGDIDIESSSIETIAVEKIPDDADLKTVNELVEEAGSEASSVDHVMRTIQTTILGRILVILLPICGIVLLLVLMITIFVKIVGKIRRKKTTDAPSSNPSNRNAPQATTTDQEATPEVTSKAP